jgi:hypothetical protein
VFGELSFAYRLNQVLFYGSQRAVSLAGTQIEYASAKSGRRGDLRNPLPHGSCAHDGHRSDRCH